MHEAIFVWQCYVNDLALLSAAHYLLNSGLYSVLVDTILY